ncbi:YgiW/YdeI family stress tolerance OB fold protein [Enterobacter roggenkampii]
MKKILMALIFTGFSFTALAQNSGFVAQDGQAASQGVFSDPATEMSTAAQAKTLRDDTWVVLEGNIVKQLGHEIYQFRDSSGTVNIEIDDKRWPGKNVSPTDKVRLEGKVEKDWNSVNIDVKSLQVLK